jgi:hypothetical protein
MVYAVLSRRQRHSAMPFICLAEALAFRKPHPEKLARTAPAGFPGHG